MFKCVCVCAAIQDAKCHGRREEDREVCSGALREGRFEVWQDCSAEPAHAEHAGGHLSR